MSTFCFAVQFEIEFSRKLWSLRAVRVLLVRSADGARGRRIFCLGFRGLRWRKGDLANLCRFNLVCSRTNVRNTVRVVLLWTRAVWRFGRVHGHIEQHSLDLHAVPGLLSGPKGRSIEVVSLASTSDPIADSRYGNRLRCSRSLCRCTDGIREDCERCCLCVTVKAGRSAAAKGVSIARLQAPLWVISDAPLPALQPAALALCLLPSGLRSQRPK